MRLKNRVRKGIIYFAEYAEATQFKHLHARDKPDARIVKYDLGWAIQIRIGGPYLGPDGNPKD